jgi:glycosyltransferase involved in cell wall biosynthesis
MQVVSMRHATDRPLRAFQVDPSMFTAPYDAALSRGLRANGVDVRWVTRALRPGEDDALAQERVSPIFYPLSDGPRRRIGPAWQAMKGVEHLIGLERLIRMIASESPDIVHFQWCVLPAFDRRAIERVRRICPVVMTVHDTAPFNGKAVARVQVSGHDRLLAGFDHLIVHGEAGRQALRDRGLSSDRISIVPHGTLPLPPAAAEPRTDFRWRVVLFGRIQHYKGVDIAIEALGRIAPEDRKRIEIIVAGEPMVPIEPLRAQAQALGLGTCLSFRPFRHSDAAMASLLRSADAFLFPYRSIEASGVLHLIAELDRWIIASDVGAFRNLIDEPAGVGALVPAGDPAALAIAIMDSVGKSPKARPGQDIPDWTAIGATTRTIYDRLIGRRQDLPAMGAAA